MSPQNMLLLMRKEKVFIDSLARCIFCVPDPQMVFRSDARTDSIGTAPSVIRSMLASLAALRVWRSFPVPCPPPVCALVHLLPSHAIAIINKLSTFSARRLRGCLARPPPSSPQSRYILSPPTCHAFSTLLICSPAPLPDPPLLPTCPPRTLLPPLHPSTSPPVASLLDVSYMPDSLWVESFVAQDVVGDGSGFFGLCCCSPPSPR